MPKNQERLNNQKLKSTFTKSSSNMKNRLLNPCVIRKISICYLLFCCVYTPSVFAQKLLKIGIGTHMLFVDGPKGCGVNATLEHSFSPHWSVGFNAELMGNSDLRQMEKLSEFRLLIQPDFRYYPQTVFQGF